MKKTGPDQGGGLRFEEHPLVSAQERRASRERPIVLAFQGVAEDGSQSALVCAWLPGALKKTRAAPPGDSKVKSSFERQRARLSDSGVLLPEELGQAAAELERLEAFGLASGPREEWEFQRLSGDPGFSLGAAAPRERGGGADLAAVRGVIEEWSVARLTQSVILDERFCDASDPEAAEREVLHSLRAMTEAAKLERLTRSKGGAKKVKRARL